MIPFTKSVLTRNCGDRKYISGCQERRWQVTANKYDDNGQELHSGMCMGMGKTITEGIGNI